MSPTGPNVADLRAYWARCRLWRSKAVKIKSGTRPWRICPSFLGRSSRWFDAALKGATLVEAGAAFETERSVPHGDVAAAHVMAAKLGLPKLLGPACRERGTADALILSRAVRPESKLSTVGWWAGGDTTLGADLEVAGASTDEVYAAIRDGGPLQMSPFDAQNFAGITHPGYPGERLICCHNPVLAADRARKRQDLLAATSKDLAKIKTSVDAGRLTGAAEIGTKVGEVIGKHKAGQHFLRDITGTSFTYRIDEEKVAAEAALDGFNVIRTSVSGEILDPAGTVTAYKNLKYVERDFRITKADDLDLRPIYHYLDNRVRGHVLICMLACYLTCTCARPSPSSPSPTPAPAHPLTRSPPPSAQPRQKQKAAASTTAMACPCANTATCSSTCPPSTGRPSPSPGRGSRNSPPPPPSSAAPSNCAAPTSHW